MDLKTCRRVMTAGCILILVGLAVIPLACLFETAETPAGLIDLIVTLPICLGAGLVLGGNALLKY